MHDVRDFAILAKYTTSAPASHRCEPCFAHNGPAQNDPRAGPSIRKAQGAGRAGARFSYWGPLLTRFSRVASALGQLGRVRLIGECAAAVQRARVAELRIAEAVATYAGGGILALLHGVEAATGHVAGHILAAIFAGSCAIGRERAKSSCDHECRSRHAEFIECFHLLVSSRC